MLSLPAWGAWIEILSIPEKLPEKKSLPAWGAWIEIKMTEEEQAMNAVAPRMGGVD